MRRVVERCPTCGVEHETPGDGACEACGTPLRVWCRTHSREIGWLEGDECPRCPPAHAHVGPRGRATAPAPAPTTAPVPSGRAAAAAPPPAPPPTVRIPVTALTPPPAAPVAIPAAPTAAEPEPAENPERRRRREPAPQGPVLRVFNAVLSLLQGGILGTLFGVGAGAFQAVRTASDIPVMAIEWGVYGGMAGLLIGGIVAFIALFGSPPPPER